MIHPQQPPEVPARAILSIIAATLGLLLALRWLMS